MTSIRRTAMGAVALALLVTPAVAQYDDSTLRRQLRSSCEYHGSCYRYRYNTWEDQWERYRVYRRPAPQVRAYIQREYDTRDDRGRCLAKHKAIGNERYDREKAREDARQAWASLVRFHWGVKYMDLQYAKDIVFTCSKSSTGERASEKVAGALTGGALQQCEIEAQPCRAERVHGSDER